MSPAKPRKKIIAVIGGHACTKEVEQLSHNLGKKLDKVVDYMVSGGLGGVMKAVCQGFKAGNGVTIKEFKSAIFVIWFLVSLYVFYPLFVSLTERRIHLIAPKERGGPQADFKFYDFLFFCKKNIPERSKVFFYISPETYGKDGITWDYHRHAVSYFLYPLKVYTTAEENKISDILDVVDFIIIRGTDKIDFGISASSPYHFELLAAYDEKNFIIKKW